MTGHLFYTEMASLEKEFKAAFGISERIKLTVAQDARLPSTFGIAVVRN